jgi:hypothetical protein
MIDQLARTSAEDLWAATTCGVEAGLADLQVRLVRRQRRIRMGLVAAAVVAAGLAATGGAVLTHRADHGVPPSHHPKPSQNHAFAYCPTDIRVTCLPHHTYRFPLVQPVHWHIPADYVVRAQTATPWLIESYRSDYPHPDSSGVTVMEHTRASTPNGNGPAAGVADTPQALVQWIANRPFLSTGPVQKTLLDGHPAWQVHATLAPDVPPGPANWNRAECYAIVYQPVPKGGKSCLYGNFVSEYTALTLPGHASTTVVWSWSTGTNPRLGPLDKLLHGLSWEHR